MKNPSASLKGREAGRAFSEPQERNNTPVVYLTHSSSRSTAASLRPRKKMTLTATFEFLELPKDMRDDFYRDNARIFLMGEQKRKIDEERSKNASTAVPVSNKR